MHTKAKGCLIIDFFRKKEIKPILIGVESEAFDSSKYIYGLKFDGVRCIAYLDGFINKGNG